MSKKKFGSFSELGSEMGIGINDCAQKMKDTIGDMSDVRVDKKLGNKMESYAIDANVVLGALRDDTGARGTYNIRDTLNELKVTIYSSTIYELCAVSDRDRIDGFHGEFKKVFNRPNVRIVDSHLTYKDDCDLLRASDPDMADFVKMSRNVVETADSHLMVQAYLEGNTIVTFDKKLASECKSMNMPVVEGYKARPEMYRGDWKSKKR